MSACCEHGLQWHHEERGCGYHGFSSDRCPCTLTFEQALAKHDEQIVESFRKDMESPSDEYLCAFCRGAHPADLDHCDCGRWGGGTGRRKAREAGPMKTPEEFQKELADAPGLAFARDPREVVTLIRDRDAGMRRETARDWADYFESVDAAVGAQPLTVETMIAALRGPQPFGTMQGGGEDV